MPKWTRENDFDLHVNKWSAHFNVPVWMIKATIAKESSFNPRAFRPEHAINDASRGLMQLLGRTAMGLGYDGTAGRADELTGLFDPNENIRLGTRYLAQLQKRFPSETPDGIYAAYNSGKPRRNEAGRFINSKGKENVNAHVLGWKRAATYFRQQEGLNPVPLVNRRCWLCPHCNPGVRDLPPMPAESTGASAPASCSSPSQPGGGG